MNIQQPKIDLKNSFELYLEGIKVDFTSISISETEGGIPAASITFPSNFGATRVLPSTIVQVFGKMHIEDKTYLLFEGEVIGINYQKSENNKIVVLKAISLLGSMIKAKFRPADAILTKERKDSDGLQEQQGMVVNTKDLNTPVGSTTLDEFKNISNKEEQVVEGRVKDIAIDAVFGLVNEFTQALAEGQPGGKGDFLPMLQGFNKSFEYNDLFYGLRSLAYKFGRSIFASPNPDLSNKIKTDLFKESLNNLQSNGINDIFTEKPYTLMQVLAEFQKYLHYNFISPATYTACRPFYVKGVTPNNEPLRMIYMPRIEAGPPALCNVFFPDQVAAFTYSRDMMNEPTRVVGRATFPFYNQGNQNIDWSPCFTFPEIDLEEEKASGNFTIEESYRGINSKILSYSNLQSDLGQDKKTTGGNGKTTSKNSKITAEDMAGDIGKLIKPYAYMDYTNMKYATRSVAISCDWDPYRMIGLPGMMLDPDGVSIVGTVNAIETSINSQGGASMRVTLRSVRLIHDTEFEETPFSKIPQDPSKGFEKYIIHDLTNDGMMSTNELLYYKDLYSFENIGKDVYTYIIHGELSPANGFYNAQQVKDIFAYAKTELDPANNDLKKHSAYVASILNYLRDENGNIILDIPGIYNKKTEIRNTYLLYQAVKRLREGYENSKYKTVNGKKEFDMKQAYMYMHAVNKRNIIQKDEYLSFIGAKIGRNLQTDDAHDGQIILTAGVTELRTKIEESAEYQYSNIITSKNSRKVSIISRINRINKLLEADPVYKFSKAETYEAYVKGYAVLKQFSQIRITIDLAKNYATTHWPPLETLLNERKTLKEELRDVSEETVPSDINFDSEIYKPYNMTRRMHIVLAFEGHRDFVTDNNTSKLKVIK
jgi:hypothetical protein